MREVPGLATYPLQAQPLIVDVQDQDGTEARVNAARGGKQFPKPGSSPTNAKVRRVFTWVVTPGIAA